MSAPQTKKRRRRPLAWLMAASRGDRAGGLALALAALAALGWANWPGHSYRAVWLSVAPWSRPLGLGLSVRAWIDEGLLFGFFTLIGLEIRREVVIGRRAARALVPVVAAVGGMLLPAVVYAAIVPSGPAAHAWGVPMATDVAFSLGTLALVGGVSPRARVFLMTLAVADDILSIVVLVAFYGSASRPGWLVSGACSLAAMVLAWALRARPAVLAVLLAGVAWWSMLHAGVEASVVGVALGLFGPPRLPSPRAERGGAGGRSASAAAAPPPPRRPGRVRRWETRLEPVVNLIVLPAFALANAGVALTGSELTKGAALRVFLAVAVARLLGKPLGIAGTTLAARSRALSRRGGGDPVARVPARGLAGLSASASVGFTVPLLMVHASLPPGPLASAATAGLLAASVAGAAATFVVLRGFGGKAGGAAFRRASSPGAQSQPHVR